MKINSITPEQAARFHEWVAKWVDIGLSTEPADFERAEAAALKVYALCKMKKPKTVLRVDSPFSSARAGKAALAMLNKDSSLSSALAYNVSHQVLGRVGSKVESAIEFRVKSEVWSEVGHHVWSRVESQVWSPIWSKVSSQVGPLSYNFRSGNSWSSGWCSYVSFIRDVLGWEDPVLQRFSIYEELASSCGWVWWDEDVLVISDRPKTLKLDTEGRLHCENGPSIEYRDGWALHNWHGVSIPGEWVTGKKPSAQDALSWKNIEQRRAACEIVGWASIIQELKVTKIDEDDDPEIGTLLEANLPGSGRQRFLQARCGTGRMFTMLVSLDSGDTALSANAWTYGLDKMNFKPEVRT